MSKNIAIVYRPRKPEAKKIAAQAVKYLRDQDCRCYTHPEQALVPGTKKLTGATKKKLDLVLTFGGDGTYLNAVRMINGSQAPILGFNLGNLGFLTQSTTSNLKKTLKQAIDGKLDISERSMLEVSIKRKGKVRAKYEALNDIVIERGPVSRLIYMTIKADSSLVSELKADGLIVSTPTGSTAYNLAAGGPIVYPGVPAVVITPICPHSLTNRPITVSSDHKLTLKLASEVQTAVFMVDGQRAEDLNSKDTIIIKKSKQKHQMLIVPDHNHFDILRSKLRFGKRD